MADFDDSDTDAGLKAIKEWSDPQETTPVEITLPLILDRIEALEQLFQKGSDTQIELDRAALVQHGEKLAAIEKNLETLAEMVRELIVKVES